MYPFSNPAATISKYADLQRIPALIVLFLAVCRACKIMKTLGYGYLHQQI